MVFLRAAPFDSLKLWTEALQNPYLSGNYEAMERLHALLRNIMWRNNKIDVEDEIKLPPQEEITEKISFSSIEV